MSAETLQAYVSLAGLVLALVGLPILFLQIRAIQRSVRSAAHRRYGRIVAPTVSALSCALCSAR